MLRFLRDRWRQRQRRLDLELLWPVCKANAGDLDHAKLAFAVHCHDDPAWIELGSDHIAQVIDALE